MTRWIVDIVENEVSVITVDCATLECALDFANDTEHPVWSIRKEERNDC